MKLSLDEEFRLNEALMPAMEEVEFKQDQKRLEKHKEMQELARNFAASIGQSDAGEEIISLINKGEFSKEQAKLTLKSYNKDQDTQNQINDFIVNMTLLYDQYKQLSDYHVGLGQERDKINAAYAMFADMKASKIYNPLTRQRAIEGGQLQDNLFSQSAIIRINNLTPDDHIRVADLMIEGRPSQK